MKKGYWVLQADVSDMEKFKGYSAAIPDIFKKYDARFIVRAGRSEIVEGTMRSRCIVIEFPSYQVALDCYHSPEYQAAKKLRQDASAFDMVIIESSEDAQTA